MYDNSLSNKLEQTVLKVYQAIDKRNLDNWRHHNEQSLWYELVACILGSKVPFEHAQASATNLQARELLNVEDCLRNCLQFETRIAEALSVPMFSRSIPERTWRYRYPRLRANHIRRTAELVYQNHGSLRAILEAGKDNPRDARVGIMDASVGLGPKQSSLFLRNIGYTDNLAILDTHVLRYMFLLGILQVRTQVLSTLSRYQEAEERLRTYTKRLGVSLAYLDTAVWVTMRVFQRESAV